MPVYKNKGLQGLRGFSELSPEEQDAFRNRVIGSFDNGEEIANRMSPDNWNTVYNMVKYRDAFEDEINESGQDISQYSIDQLSDMYKHKIVSDALNEQYGNNESLLYQLDYNKVSDDGIIDLLESGYMNDEQWTAHSNKTKDNFREGAEASMSSGYMGQIGVNPWNWEEKANEILAKDKENQQKILDKIIYDDNQRTIDKIQQSGLVDGYENFLKTDSGWTHDKVQAYHDDIMNGFWVDEDGNRIKAVPKYSEKVQAAIDNIDRQIAELESNTKIRFAGTTGQGMLAVDDIEQLREKKRRIEAKGTDAYDFYYVDENGNETPVPDKRQLTDEEMFTRGMTKPRSEYSEEELTTDFEKIHIPGNPYFKAFKDKKELEGYSDEDMYHDVALYLAIGNQYGFDKAHSALNSKTQGEVAHNQSWFTNWFPTTGTKLTLNLMQELTPEIVFVRALGAAGTEVEDADGNVRELSFEDAFSNIMAGLNPDGSEQMEFDYWNTKNQSLMERANSFDPEYLKFVTENEGISGYTHVYNPEDGDRLTWEKGLFEGSSMVAFTLGQIAMNFAVTKGLGALGSLGKAGGSFARLMEASTPYVGAVVTAVPISHAYAYGSVEQVMAKGTEQINKMKYDDANAYFNSLVESNPELYEQMVQSYIDNNQPTAITDSEGRITGYQNIKPSNMLRQEAEAAVKEDVVRQYTGNSSLWTKDYTGMEEDLKKDAAFAYHWNFGIELLANASNSLTFGKWKMTDVQKKALNKNSIFGIAVDEKNRLVQDFEIWGKTLTERQMKALYGIGTIGKNVWGGGQANALDDVRAAVAQELGLTRFNNRINYEYNIQNYENGYREANNLMNLTDYITASDRGFQRSIRDKQTYIDGAIGALGSLITIAPSASIAKVFKGVAPAEGQNKGNLFTRNELFYTPDGQRLSAVEVAANIIANPALDALAEAEGKMRNTKRYIKKTNDLLDLYESDIRNIGTMLNNAERVAVAASAGVASPLDASENFEQGTNKLSTDGEMHDASVFQAFDLLAQIERWKADPYLKDAKYINELIDKVENFYKEQISEEDVEEFIYDKSNQWAMRRMSLEEKRAYAREVLAKKQSNLRNLALKYANEKAKALAVIGLTEEDLRELVDKGEYKHYDVLEQLIFNRVQAENWTNRRNVLMEELGISDKGYNKNWFGSEENYEAFHRGLSKQIDYLEKQKENMSRELAELEANPDRTPNEKAAARIYAREMTKRIDSDLKALRKKIKNTTLSENEIQNLENTILTADEILGLDAETQYQMLNPNNYEEFSKAQQAEIKKAQDKANLIDHNYLIKLNDVIALKDRIDANDFSYQLMTLAPKQVYDYVNNTRKAFEINKQLAVTEIANEMLFDWLDHNNVDEFSSNFNFELSDNFLSKYLEYNPDAKPEVDRYLMKRSLKASTDLIMADIGKLTQNISEDVNDILNDSRTTEDAMTSLDRLLNEYTANQETGKAKALSEVLNKLAKNGFVRNATVMHDRKTIQKELARKRKEERQKQEALRVEREKQVAEEKRREAEKQAALERERKIKEIAKREYSDEREKEIEPTTKEDYMMHKRQAKELSRHYVREMLNGKSLVPLRRAILKDTADATSIIDAIQKYRNAEKKYGYLWDRSQERTVAAIEKALRDAGYSWTSIEGEVLDESMRNDVMVNNTRHDDNILRGVTIAENSSPYIYKDGVLISRPKTDLAIGMKEVTDEALAPRKEWKRVRTDFRKFENQLVEVPYTPYRKKQFSTRKKSSALDKLFSKLDELGLSQADHETIILEQIARGAKFKWTGDDTSKGIGLHLFSKPDSERKNYRTIIDEENGYTPETFAEMLTSEYGVEFTASEVNDVLRNNTSKKDAIEALRNKIAEHISEEERMAEAARQREIYEQQQALAKEMGFESVEEMEAMATELAEQLEEEQKQQAAKHEEELLNKEEAWQDEIDDIYYNTETEDETGTTEEPAGEEPARTEKPESESTEVLQGEQPSDRTGLEGAEPIQTDSEGTSIDASTSIPQTILTELAKMPSEMTAEEQVSEELEQNPNEDVQTFKAPSVETRTETPSRSDRLHGNQMYLFNLRLLDSMGIYDTTLPETSKARQKLQDFLNERKIRLQDIIDFELGKIIEKYPSIPIRFMKQKGSNNIYNVIEYTDDVAALHDEELGGVIESGGKKWLMIGVLGYEMKRTNATEAQNAVSNAQRASFETISNFVNEAMQNSNEEFFVHPTIYTKILEQTNGYFVNRASEESQVEQHSVKSLLENKETNPHGLRFETLKFGVQKGDTFVTYNLADGLFFPIKDKTKLGSSYILVPTANGNYAPMYIQPTYYKLLQEGKLKDTIDNILIRLADPNLANNVAAARIIQRELENYIAFGNNESGVRLAIYDNGGVQITVDGVAIATTTLGNIDARFLDTLKNQNLRISVDKAVFINRSKFDMYSDAGALNVTSTMLGMRGSLYTVSPITTKGTPAITTKVKSGVLRDNERELPVKDRLTRNIAGTAYYGNIQYYRLASSPDVWRNIDGTEVTDAALIDKLKYAEFIGQHRGEPSYSVVSKQSKKLYQYFIYDESSKTGLRYDTVSDTFEVMTTEEFDRLCQTIQEEKQKQAAKEKLAETTLWEESPVETTAAPIVEEPAETPVTPASETVISNDTRNLQTFKNSGTFAITDFLSGKAGKEERKAVVDALLDFAKRKGMNKPNVPQILKALEENGVTISEQKNINDWLDNINNCK